MARKGFLVLAMALAIMGVPFAMSGGTPQPLVPEGFGTYANPFKITHVRNLLWMSQNVNLSSGRFFVLVNDIDASDTAQWDSWRGFPPIGTEGNKFGGIVSGQGYRIIGLVQLHPEFSCTGLFGYVDGGSIANLELVDCKILGGGSYTGAIAGYLKNGGISNCSVTGSVSGNSYVGGLVGYAYKSTIQWGYTVAEVSGGDYVGGLIGMNANEATLSGCYTMGSVSGGLYVGGISGWSTAAVVASYSTATVSGNDRVGGIIGQNASTLSCCYAAGRVIGKEKYSGGLVGYGNVNIGDSYWDRQTTGQFESAGSKAYFGLSSAQMKAQGSYFQWNFNSFWGISSDLNQGYPHMRNLVPWQTYTARPVLTFLQEKGKLKLSWLISQGGILERSAQWGKTWEEVAHEDVQVDGDYYVYRAPLGKTLPRVFYRLSRSVVIQPSVE